MKSASPKGSSSTSDEETRKRHTSPKPANSKDSSSSAEDNVTCGNYANEKEKSKKRELSPARTSSHSETKSACQGSNAEKESMLEEQVKLRSSSSISSSTSEDEGKPLDRSRENAAMTEKQDDMPHTDDISDDRNQIKLEVCVNEQPSSSVADDIESQVKLPSLELATTSDVSENKAAENDTEVKDKYVPSSAETLEVKVNILAETGDSAQETAPETEAIKNIEVSVDISLGQQLVRSRSDVEDDAETQERPMTVTVLPSCAHIRPDEPKSKGRSDSESSSISEEIGVQEETQKTGTCTETPVIRDTTPGDSLGENKTGDEVEVPIDVDQELDFDVVGLVSNVVNESRSPVHLTTQGEIQDSPVIVEKIVTDVTQENAPLGKDDALERRSSTSSESSSSGSDGEKGGKMNVDAPISDLVPTSKEDVIVRCDEQKTENQPAAPMPKSEVLEDSAEEQQVDAGKNDMQDSPLPSTNETSSPKSEEETQQSKETSEPNQSFSDNEYQTKETNLPTFAVDDQTGKQWRKKSRTSDTSSSSSPSDDSEDSIKAKTSEAAHEKIVRASSSSSSSETSAEQDEKLSPEKTPNVIEDLCDAIIPEKPSSASHEDKNVVKKEGSNEKKNDVKTEDPTVSNTSSSSHSSESSVDDHRRDSAEHNEKQDMVKQEDEPSTVSLDIEVDIMKEVDKPAGESGKSPEPETSVVLETHMASQFAVAEEFPSSDSEDQEAHEVIIGIDKVEPTQAVERQSPPATEVVNAEMEAENGIDDGTFGKKERTTVEVASSCDEGERNSVPESQDDSLAILVTKIVPNENESQEEILTEVTKSELDQTPQHIPTPLDDISQLPVSVPKEEISLFQSPECLSETPKTIAESFDNKTETQESLKPAAPSSLPASTKPSRKYSDQYSNFETPRDSRYRLQDMQERSKSSVGQQRTRIRPQVEVTSAVLPCLVEVRTALPPSGIPSEVLENMENVTDVMKEEKPPKVAELIVPETLTNVNQGNKEMESLPVGDNVVEVSLEQHLSAMDEKHSPAAVSSSSSSSSDSEENKAKTDKSQDCEKEKKTPKKETERKSRASSSSTSSSSDSDENRKRRKTSRKSSSSSSDSSARKHKIDKRKDSASKQPVAVKKEKQKRSSSSSSSDSHEKRQHRKSDTLATAEVGDKVAISTSSDSSSDEGATKSHRRNSVEKEGRKPSSSDKEETAPDLKDKRKPTKTSSSSGTSSSSSSSSSDENAKPEKEASKSSSSTSSSSSSSEDDVKNSHTHDRRKKKSHGSSSDDTEVKKSTEKKEKVNRSGSSVSSSSDKEGSQAKTSGSEKGHPSRPHKTSESSKSSDSSSSDSRSSDSENEAKKRKDVSSVPDVKEATDEPHPKLPLAPPPTSRLPLQTSRDEEILEIVEKVLEDSEIGSLDRNAPSSAIHESIDGKNDADQMKDDALPTSDQNGLEDWVIVPETVDETQAAPHIVNEKTRDPELTQHESSNLHGPTPETISKEEPVEGERGQPVSEWVNMWDSAISAGLYPTPTADVSKRLQELHSEPQQPEAASNAKQSDPETATKPEDAPSGSSSVEAPQVIAKEEAGIVRAEPARLIEDEPCVDTNVSEQPPVSGVEGAFEAILVNVVPELPIDDNQSKVEKNSEDLDKPSEKTIRDKTEDETYQASLCYIDPELPSPVEKDGDADNTCPDLMRPEDTLSESLPAFVREPVPAVWRRASVDRQVGKFNITCIIRPNEAHLHGSETRVTPPRQTDRKWLNLENYTIMPPPQSPESVRKNTAESDLGSKTTVYLTPRSPPNARQELVALRCVRNSEDDSSLTYLPELRDLTPDIGDGEKSFHWNGRSKEVDKSTVPHLHSQPPLADVKKKRLAYENGSSAAHKELRKVTPPHNANLEERKQKLLGSTTDIVSKVKQPVAEPGKVGRLRAMFEQMDAAAARAPGRDETLRDSRRFKSMMNVTAPSTTGRSSRLEEPTLKERSRSTAALHRAPSGGLGAELSVAPESVKERSRSTVNLNHREGDEKPSWDAVDSGSIKHRSRSTVGLNGTSSASPRAGLSAAPDSVKERSRSAATLHQPEKADKGEDAVDSAPAKERSPSVSRQPEGSLSPQGPTGHDSPPASSEFVTLEERDLSSRALDELEDGDHQAKLDAIRRYFEGLQDGDITAGDDMDMLDDALVPDRGYNRSLPRLDASASDRRPPLTDLFTEPERGTRSLNRSASSPLVSAEGAGGAATLLDQVRQLRRRRASGGALSQTSLATSIASTAELARHRDDGIVVFGPGMCQGKVNAVNRFQILVPHADQAPMGVRLYSQRTDSVTRVELRDLGCDYHQVAYRVNQPGWYRLYVRLGGGARHVDLMTKVSH
ncbi:serine-rich adhesin for platelets-like [Amphibalanus amphitrite]|uniref:serine-rich adhesin for platelets-like n=1 Tax=Amphibalanus amphitrite TaxID=1232801 RepID=UPI001C901C40|nr:serine-rich adhesin for platelets-like [Amphibalanus amphitrite]XP_043202686.1 serine-rich adhesin for platelets-like [Amphibalanus amphitrite]